MTESEDEWMVEALQARLEALDSRDESESELEAIALQVHQKAEQVRARRVEAETELQRLFRAGDAGIADLAEALARARTEQARQEKLLALDASIRSRSRPAAPQLGGRG